MKSIKDLSNFMEVGQGKERQKLMMMQNHQKLTIKYTYLPFLICCVIASDWMRGVVCVGINDGECAGFGV